MGALLLITQMKFLVLTVIVAETEYGYGTNVKPITKWAPASRVTFDGEKQNNLRYFKRLTIWIIKLPSFWKYS